MKRLEVAANVSVLVVALLICTVLTKQFLLPHPNQPLDSPGRPQAAQVAEPLKGKPLAIQGVTWSPRHPTLVMALATYCHFCIDSAPFYHTLSDMEHQGKLHADVVAAFPEDTGQARTFASKYGFQPDKIVSTSLDSIGVEGTPTLLLVGADGHVQRQWTGRLSETDQNALVKLLTN